jgi:glutamate-1-semialdehyde 2,1-aminomutase
LTEDLFQRASRSIPGGVNSPVRAFGAVGGTPPFVRRAHGAYVETEDGRRLIDYVGSWGPMILGHAHPEVIAAVQAAAADGLSFGAPTQRETALAELLCERVPGLERVRMVSSGTEATMSAIRLARGATGRDLLVKFEGCYHGHADSLLVKAGSGALTFGVPTSPGVPAATAACTLTLDYNDAEQVEALFAERGSEIAAVIVEPIAGNMNLVPGTLPFLEALRRCCDSHGAILIFDEVMSGFRAGPAGAIGLTGIRPDLVTLGKVIGGGLPVGAFGGDAKIMAQLAPEGPVYQAGTLSGCPVAMAAGQRTLELIGADGFFDALEARTRSLVDGLSELSVRHGVASCTVHRGGMFGLFFTGDGPVERFAQVMACDQDRFRRFFHGMLDHGIYLAPSAFETGFVSAAHTDAEIEATLAAADEVLASL